MPYKCSLDDTVSCETHAFEKAFYRGGLFQCWGDVSIKATKIPVLKYPEELGVETYEYDSFCTYQAELHYENTRLSLEDVLLVYCLRKKTWFPPNSLRTSCEVILAFQLSNDLDLILKERVRSRTKLAWISITTKINTTILLQISDLLLRCLLGKVIWWYVELSLSLEREDVLHTSVVWEKNLISPKFSENFMRSNSHVNFLMVSIWFSRKEWEAERSWHG